jgi:hypothetical protein
MIMIITKLVLILNYITNFVLVLQFQLMPSKNI